MNLAQNEERQAWEVVNRLRTEISELQMRERDIIITEHAYVRFFERILGYNLDKVKDEILPPEHRQRLLGKFYAADHWVGDSHKVTVRDGKVITVNLPDKKPPKIAPIKDGDFDDDLVGGGDAPQVAVTDEHGEGGGGASL